MIDIENLIIEKTQSAIDEKTLSVLVLGQYEEIPEEFPCVMIQVTDNSTYEFSLDGAEKEHHASLSIQFDIFSNKSVGAKAEVKAIAHIIDDLMLSLKFVRRRLQIIPNIDRSVTRCVASYSGIVGEPITSQGNTIYPMYR